MPPAAREMHMVTKGGSWKNSHGVSVGNGTEFHFKEGIRHLWPDFAQHRWFDLFLHEWLTHDYIGVIGPKNSGKTEGAAIVHLFDWYCFPDVTSVLCCSTTMEMLENRIWGSIKKRHRAAKMLYSWIPGHIIEGRQRIVLDDRAEIKEGRDLRNGLQGIPLKLGNAHQGMSSIIGIKNKRKRICGDELQCLPRAIIDSMANFMEPGADCKITGMGNPAETTDSLGILCEPHVTLGGWDGGIDQTPNTKTWKTRFENGVCIQFPGSDSPNYDVKEDEPVPYPFLMTRERMAKDAETWGKSDWHFTMFNEPP